MSLKKYNEKRKFNETAEPEGKVKKGAKKLVFVVQRHAASRLHYDFRLEMDGVLKSWAVPKGPSLNPADKRLAMMVEDHPYDYRTFEGTIPKGNYGAGEVEIWDEGTYEALQKVSGKKDEGILLKELYSGSIKIIMHGKKLKGEFALVKLKSAEEGNAWLLIKHRDKYAVNEKYDAEEHTKKNSKVTEAVKAKAAKKSSSVPVKKKAEPEPEKRYRNFDKYISGEKKVTNYIKPMLATLSKNVFSDKNWVFEIKWDGYRAIAELKDGFRFYSRNGLSFASKYPPIVDALQQQKHEMILDGEIVAYNEEGLPHFQSLQHYGEKPVPLIYHVFDLLYLNGSDTTGLTLLQRKELLKEALTESDHIKYCDHVAEDGEGFFEVIKKKGLEGMIAKETSSNYAIGRRSTNWLKIKNLNTEEVVIAGYTKPRGSRSKFGALILGRYEGDELIYAGHTGTGFDEISLQELYEKMQPLVVEKSPFKVTPKTNMPATWIKPELVCNIKYSEITRDGIFRHPVFTGLRIDKPAEEITTKPDDMPLKKTAAKKTTTRATAAKKSAAKNSAGVSKNTKTVERENEIVKKIGKAELKLTNQNKIYWPDDGYTKGDLIDYYEKMADYILPYLKGRPESLNRFPNGIKGDSFYHKDAGDTAPGWVSTAKVFSESNQKDIDYIVCNNKATLLYLANLGCIEMNPWNSTTKNLENPTYMIIDIDPSDNNTFEHVIETALATKEVLDGFGAESCCKTSGASGLHVFVPMGAKYNYEQIKTFAHLVATKVTEMLPDLTTLERSLSKRSKNKIYVDYLQNRGGQTIASVYSLRPKPGATASTPLDWKEVKSGLSPKEFDINTLPERVKKTGDIFKPVLGKGFDLKKLF